MADYGFDINVGGDILTQLSKMRESIDSMGTKSATETQKVTHSFTQMGEKIKGIMSELKGVILGSLAVGGIWGGFEFIKGSIEAFDNLEKSVTRVNTVIQSTKGAAGFSAEAIEEQAKELSKSIVNGRSEIMDAQGMLLSFTGIKGSIFGEATKAVSDFATFYKMDMTSAALDIGKALNDPEKGMTRLQRQGVTFTEQQKEQIKNYEKQGQLAKAQEVILKELNTEFGGQAKAFAMTDEGKLKMAEKSWGDMKLQIGEVFSKIQVSLIPAFKDFVAMIKSGFNSAPVQFLLTHLKDLIGLVVKAIPSFLIYKGIMLSINVIEKIRTINLKELGNTIKNFSWATKEATVVTEGMTAAEEAAAVGAETFSTALISTGVGAFAIAIGLLIGQISKMNDEFQESIDKVTNLKSISTGFGENQDKITALNQKAAIFGQLPQTLQIENYKAIKEQIESIGNQNSGDVAAAIKTTQEAIKNPPMLNNAKYGKIINYEKLQELNNQLSSLKDIQAKNNTALYSLNSSAKVEEAYFKSHKIDINKAIAGGGAVTQDATNTSALSGASGGLGQAKVINITFKDAFQKITTSDNKQLPQQGQNAVEQMIRAINNIAYNEGQTQ
jgi:tetratricopeptide (TPR) repeat protein